MNHSEKPGSDFLTPRELTERWKRTITLRTLANWRYTQDGPKFTKVGGRILYKLADVEEYERRRTSR